MKPNRRARLNWARLLFARARRVHARKGALAAWALYERAAELLAAR